MKVLERVILHSDLNNFYASVECFFNPDIRNKPVAVSGNPEARHGIVLAKNYFAKAYGVKTGEALWQAKQKCPDIVFVPPNYELYLKYSRLAKEIYSEYTNQVESFGLDECWLDVSKSTGLFGSGKVIADNIRQRIKEELGVTASIGVSFNKVFAKLGSDMKKPDATTIITKDNFKSKVWSLPANDLIYVGSKTYKKLLDLNIHTIGDLAKADILIIKNVLGKIGIMLWNFANGRDNSKAADIDSYSEIKSVGNSITLPYDLTTDNDIKITLMTLSESVAARLREYGFRCSTVQISIRDKNLFSYERQGRLNFPSCLSEKIYKKAFELYKKNHLSFIPIRSLSVRVSNLSNTNVQQISFLDDYIKEEKQLKLEEAVDSIRNRFGHYSVQKGIVLSNPTLSAINPKEEHIIHPAAFLK